MPISAVFAPLLHCRRHDDGKLRDCARRISHVCGMSAKCPALDDMQECHSVGLLPTPKLG